MLHSTSRITCICAFVVLETLTCENQADVKPSTAMHIAKWHQILEVEVEETKAWHLPLLGHSFPWRGRGSRLAKVFHHVAGKLVDGDPRRELLLPFQDLHGLAGPRTHHSWLPVLVPAHRGDADAHRATHNVRSASFLTAFFFCSLTFLYLVRSVVGPSLSRAPPPWWRSASILFKTWFYFQGSIPAK